MKKTWNSENAVAAFEVKCEIVIDKLSENV